MKKKLIILLTSLTTVALLIIGGFAYYNAQKEAEYVSTAVPYVKRVIPELSKWDPVVARQYMSADFLEKTPADVFERILRALATLGELQQLEEPEFGQVYIGDTPGGEKQTVVSYTVKARYSTGDAEITLNLLDLGDAFQVYRFSVRSEALLRQ